MQASRIELGLGEYDSARVYVEEARRLLPAAHAPLCTGSVYQGFGDISHQQEQWQAARRFYTQARAAFQPVYNARGLLPNYHPIFSCITRPTHLIFKETLHNVVKHAQGATLVIIRVSHDAGQLCLNVRDNAPGPTGAVRPGGHGLANMHRRAEAVGGSLYHEAEATGFGVVTCLPG